LQLAFLYLYKNGVKDLQFHHLCFVIEKTTVYAKWTIATATDIYEKPDVYWAKVKTLWTNMK
jgi:hypothetical protein